MHFFLFIFFCKISPSNDKAVQTINRLLSVDKPDLFGKKGETAM